MPTDSVLDLSGRVALVTGGTRGVGAGITAVLLSAGAQVVACGRTEPEKLPAASGRQAVFVAADVRDPDQAAAAVDDVVRRFGRIDLAVNNAGGSPAADAATVSPRFVEKIVALNLLAPFYVAQAANRHMQQQPDGGSIVNVGSLSGRRPSPGSAAYGAAKAGLVNLTASLAMEWAPKVRVNCLTVGYVVTEQAHLFYGDEAGIAAVNELVPMGRMANPRDVGNAVLYLASGLAAYVTGANLEVHGGGEPPPFLRAVAEATGVPTGNKAP